MKTTSRFDIKGSNFNKASTRMKVQAAVGARNAHLDANSGFKNALRVTGAAVGGGLVGAAVGKGIVYLINK